MEVTMETLGNTAIGDTAETPPSGGAAEADSAGASKAGSVAEQVLGEIRSRIARGELKPNDRIPTEAELAKQFSVSRASVREAIKTLDYLGIVESNTSRGTRITNRNQILEKAASWSAVMNTEDIHDAFVLGTALDAQVAIIIAERLHHEQNEHEEFKKDIIQILSRMALAAVQQDQESFDEGFYAFFRETYAFSQNTIFVSLNECINNLIHERVCNAYHSNGAMLEAVRYLNDIWNAILDYRKYEAIELFQDYGAFAWEKTEQNEMK